jgi:hypothetical protein
MARKLCDGAQTTRLTFASVFASQSQEPTVAIGQLRSVGFAPILWKNSQVL